MIYVTVRQHRKPRQLTWEDVIADNIVLSDYTLENSNSTATITRKFEHIDENILSKVDVAGMISWLKKFNEDNKRLFEMDRNELFNSFKIPKSTGGFRPIDEPLEPLKSELYRLTSFFRDDCGLLYHTSAFAYIEGRSIVDNNKKHVRNKSNWYLKTDFSGFFPHTNLDFVMKMLSMVFPMSEVCKDPTGFKELRKAISLNYKANGEMPQGSPLSPFLTNWIMIPVDFRIFNELSSRHMIYTRYADDIMVSAQEKFPWMNIVKLIRDVLKEFDAPYTLKDEKTRFGSVKGNNWNLGLMCNGNYDITVGYRNKKYFKSALCSFILDTKNKKYWDMDDVYHLRGLLSYYTMVEKDYFENLIAQQNKKWQVNVKSMLKDYLNGKIA